MVAIPTTVTFSRTITIPKMVPIFLSPGQLPKLFLSMCLQYDHCRTSLFDTKTTSVLYNSVPRITFIMFWSPLPTCPLLAMHSGAVMQVPLSPVVELHTALGKFTIEKRLQDKYYQILYFTAFRVGRCWGGGEGEGIGEAWEASYKRFSYLDSARKKISHLNIFSCLVMSWLVFVFCQVPWELIIIIRQVSTV